MLVGLVNNAALLVMLGVLYDLVGVRVKNRRRAWVQVSTGLVIGIIGIAVMLNPWTMLPGVVFDTRTVLLTISGLFFGAIPTLIAILMTGLFRLFQGGAGAWTGVITILASGGTGLLWRIWKKDKLEKITWWELYAVGLMAHALMLLSMFTLPWPMPLDVLSAIGLPVMLIHPTGTLLLGWLIVRRMAREKMKDQLAASEERWKFALEGAGDGVWDWDALTDQVYFSHQWKAMLGYADYEIQDNLEEWEKRLHPEDREHVFAALKKHFDGEAPLYISEHRLLCKNGKYLWVLDRGKIVSRTQDGKPWRVIGTHTDISERKQAEDERKATIELLGLVNSNVDDHELIDALLGYFKNWSGCQVVGIRLNSGEDYPYFETSGFPEKPFFTAGGSFWTNSTSQLLNSTSENDRQSLTCNRCHGEGYESVALIPLRSGKETLGLIQMNDQEPGRFSAGSIALFERLANNIANFLAKKQAERKLQASQERYRVLFEYAAVPMVEEDFSGIQSYFDQIRQAGVQDIRAHLQADPQALMHCISQARTLDVNQRGLQFFGATKTELQTDFGRYFEPASLDVFQDELAALAEGATEYTCEIPVRLLDGSRKHLSLHISVVPGYEKTLGRLLVSFYDISQQKQSEEGIKTALREKEVLLRELYHRTKNNMQVIRSMLVLQTAQSTDVEVHRLVQETENKIQAMALVHQMLYQSQNLSSINLQSYIKELAELVLSSYGGSSHIHLRLALTPQMVSIDVATPLGLILNELLSNACKHAFPHKRQGEICITLRRNAENLICFEFSDNGVGVPADFDLRGQTSYGLLSLFSLAEGQLSAQVQVDTHQGLAYKITFPDSTYPARI